MSTLSERVREKDDMFPMFNQRPRAKVGGGCMVGNCAGSADPGNKRAAHRAQLGAQFPQQIRSRPPVQQVPK